MRAQSEPDEATKAQATEIMKFLLPQVRVCVSAYLETVCKH